LNSAAAQWTDGDFNLDYKVTGADYAFIDSNLGKGVLTPLAYLELQSEMIALHTHQFGGEYTAAFEALQGSVPEPASFGFFAAGMLALLRRRRTTHV
jgi:MYXO-CTERM domain-containing protein